MIHVDYEGFVAESFDKWWTMTLSLQISFQRENGRFAIMMTKLFLYLVDIILNKKTGVRQFPYL